MIAAVPLPSWRQLARLFGPRPDPEVVAAPWRRPGEEVVWFSRSSHSIAAIARSAARRLGHAPLVAVPAYFCSATLDPLRRIGARLVYLPVDRDLVVDWDSCGEYPDVVLAPHTFGQPAALDRARALCRRSGGVLIEDCAHVLQRQQGVGETGDYAVWSPHKLLALPQGGLVICRSGISAGDLDGGGASPAMGTWLVKRLLQKTLPATVLPPSTRSGPQRFEDDPVGVTMPDTPMLSAAAARLLAALPPLASVAVRRRAIAEALLAELSRRGGWQPLFPIQPAAPYRLVMRCTDAATATHRFDEYRARGIPVESWPDMPPEVSAAPDRHGAALELRRTLLCFPCHQDLAIGPLLVAARRTAADTYTA